MNFYDRLLFSCLLIGEQSKGQREFDFTLALLSEP